MKNKVCLFAGTTEGRRLAELLHDTLELTVCVATEYGEILLENIPGIRIHTGRMDVGQMKEFFSENRFACVIDATHPYAVLVTENIQAAADAYPLPYIRVLREDESSVSNGIYVPSAAKAREYLAKTEGNILLTTGSKELREYVGLDMTRVWARVLPLGTSLAACRDAGIPPAHIIAAQGPFGEEINIAQLRAIDARYLVTKASGSSGGYEEKLRAAQKAGAIPVIIGQPVQADGYSLEETMIKLQELFPGCRPMPRIAIAGIGTGGQQQMTLQVCGALRDSDTIIGAKSVVDAVNRQGKNVFYEFQPSKVKALLESHPAIRNAVIVMRGDTGFYSGAKGMMSALREYDVTLLPGISSISCFAARLGVSWDNAELISLHGRSQNLIHAVSTNQSVFALTGGENTVSAVCRKLCDYGYGDLPVSIGERLSYPDEKISHGTAKDFVQTECDSLSVLWIQNSTAISNIRHGIPDEAFIRGATPMTKAEVRSISLSKLELDAGSVVYDIGAGTGSVSVECALAAHDGQVYAIEKDPDAANLIRQNKVKFACDNLSVIEGIAPEALEPLPPPTHAFIGGSSGNLREILVQLLKKNPLVRIVINTVTLETQAEVMNCIRELRFAHDEIVSVQISRAKTAGRYHLMSAQNPVCIITLSGGAAFHE